MYTLPETNIAPENRPSEKEYSNYPFSGAMFQGGYKWIFHSWSLWPSTVYIVIHIELLSQLAILLRSPPKISHLFKKHWFLHFCGSFHLLVIKKKSTIHLGMRGGDHRAEKSSNDHPTEVLILNLKGVYSPVHRLMLQKSQGQPLTEMCKTTCP